METTSLPPTDQLVTYRLMHRSESPVVAKFQYEMALETEGKELNTVEVTKAVQFISDNSNRGFYVVGSVDNENQPSQAISSELLTFGFDIMRGTPVWWFQSVYVEPKYRGKGIFKGMFHEAEKIDEQKYPLRLYVEVENKRAQQVYQRLGMFDTNEVFLEDDFHFDDRLEFKDTNEFTFEMGNQQDLLTFKDRLRNNNLQSLMNKDIVDLDKTLKCIDYMISGEHRGGLIVVKSKKISTVGEVKEEKSGEQEKLNEQASICYVPVFYEYSDWRNGDMLYLYDLRVAAQNGLEGNNQESISFQQNLISSLMFYLKTEYQSKAENKLTNIRWIITESSSFREQLLTAGLQQAHYRVYEKNTFA